MLGYKKNPEYKDVASLQKAGYLLEYYNNRFRFYLTFIYIIKCPVSSHVVYVGQSIDPKSRIKQHFYNKNNSLISMWCNAMLSLGLTPIMSIIDGTYSDAKYLEDFYIKYYKTLGQANHNRFHTGGQNTYSLYIGNKIGKQPSINYDMLNNYLTRIQ